MADISKITTLDGTTYNVKDAVARETKIPIVTFGDPTVLVDTTTVSFSKDGDHDWYVSSANPLAGFTTSSFVDSAVFVVEWDGTEYEALCRMHRDVTSTALTYSFYSIGSISPLGYAGFPEDGFPFAIVRGYLNASNVLVFSYDTEASHTIKITKIPFTRTLIDDTYFLKSHRQLSAIRVCLGSNNDFGIAEGYAKSASFIGAHAEGLGTDSRQVAAHAEGCGTIAGGYSCHAEGLLTTTSGNYAHSEGLFSSASEEASHAEGRSTSASGRSSHAEGRETSASGRSSHAEGEGTVANHRNQHVFGQFNVVDPSSENAETIGNYAEIVGNGTANNSRSNARTLDWSGNEVLSGGLTVNSTSGITIGQTAVNETELTGMKEMLGLSSTLGTVGSASLGTAIAADDITSWSANTPSSASVSGGVLTFAFGTAASLSYTARSIPNVSVSNVTVVTEVTVGTGTSALPNGDEVSY